VYPTYFNKLQGLFPETYADLTRHDSLPMSDEIKRDLLVFDMICSLYIAEIVEKWLISGGSMKDQTIFEKDCHVIKQPGRFQFQTYENLVKEYASPDGPDHITVEQMNAATLSRMERFMEMFQLNSSELNSAYEQLKEWRFHLPPKDNVFERRFQITEMIDLRFPQQQ
jgi:hypothetical protein